LDLKLRRIEESERASVCRLIDDYFAELAGYQERAIGPVDAAGDQYLPLYWTEPTRHPFFVELNGKAVGFVLVRVISDPAADVAELAEFYIQPGWRRQGLGRHAAIAALNRFPGRWQLQVALKNHIAAAFWPRCIEAVASGVVSREEFESEDGRRVRYRFTTRAAA
jgi:predicted acetyltransferase